MNEGNRAVGYSGDPSDQIGWSIPGTHTPVAVMVHSWLETCQAAPFPLREVEEGKVQIPFYTEEVEGESSESANIESPPTEIVVPDNDSANAASAVSPPPSTYRKFSLWGDIADDRRVDWWYTLRVLRDCSDLVAAGWRPPPHGQVGEGIILILISIAEKGISHLAVDDDIKQEMTEERIRKERLVACSCASESLVAIKTLASRDVIPIATIRPLALSLCQLLSAAESTVSRSLGTEIETPFEDAMFENEIRNQMTLVSSNSAELLWVLLSNDNNACPTTDALLDAIDLDLSVEITEENIWLVQKSVVTASGAIRALSAAMWGDPPTVKGVPLLRFFWEVRILLPFDRIPSLFDLLLFCHARASLFITEANC